MTIPRAIRREVLRRDNYTCRHCGRRRDLTVDHIVPRAQGGFDHPSNLQTLCRTCNSSKGVRSDSTVVTLTERHEQVYPTDPTSTP